MSYGGAVFPPKQLTFDNVQDTKVIESKILDENNRTRTLRLLLFENSPACISMVISILPTCADRLSSPDVWGTNFVRAIRRRRSESNPNFPATAHFHFR